MSENKSSHSGGKTPQAITDKGILGLYAGVNPKVDRLRRLIVPDVLQKGSMDTTAFCNRS